MFDNREIALFVWVIIFLCVLLISKGTRKSIFDFLKVLVEPFILKLFAITGLLVIFVSILLTQVSLWSFAYLKISIFWFFFVGVPFLFKDYKNSQGKDIFKIVFLKSITPTIIVELIANIQTFNIWIEILLVPIEFTFALIVVFADYQVGLQKVKIFVQSLLICLGIWFTIKGINASIINISLLLNAENFAKIGLPIIYSLAFFPFVFFFALYMEYEQIFVRLNMFYKNDKKYICSLKKYIFKSCGFSLRKIRNLSKFPYHIAEKINDIPKQMIKYANANNNEEISSMNVELIESTYN